MWPSSTGMTEDAPDVFLQCRSRERRRVLLLSWSESGWLECKSRKVGESGDSPIYVKLAVGVSEFSRLVGRALPKVGSKKCFDTWREVRRSRADFAESYAARSRKRR